VIRDQSEGTVIGLFSWCDASAEYLVESLSSSSAVDARRGLGALPAFCAIFLSESSASFFTGADMLRATRWLATNPA